MSRHLAADCGCMLRTHVLPAIVALWGAAVVIHAFVVGTDGTGAYASGELAGAAVGLVMVFVGGRALLKTRAS